MTVISWFFFDSRLLFDTFQCRPIWISRYSHIKIVAFRDEKVHLGELAILIYIHWQVYSIVAIWYRTNKTSISFIRHTNSVYKQLWRLNKSLVGQTQMLFYFYAIINVTSLYNAIRVYFCHYTWPDIHIRICTGLIILIMSIESWSNMSNDIWSVLLLIFDSLIKFVQTRAMICNICRIL